MILFLPYASASTNAWKTHCLEQLPSLMLIKNVQETTAAENLPNLLA
jgi:hypothetical protein